MSEHPENPPEEHQPIRGQVRYSQVSARVPESVGEGAFASAVMVMTGPFEHVLDFIMRLSEKPRVVARVVLPTIVAGQFVRALEQNIANYEANFGSLPKPPQFVRPPAKPDVEPPPPPAAGRQPNLFDEDEVPLEDVRGESPQWTAHPSEEELHEPPHTPPPPVDIEQIYDELRLPDSLLSGRYANAVLIRHSPTEFCFDFITNIFPRSAVSSRVYLAAANVGGLLQSLRRSLGQPS